MFQNLFSRKAQNPKTSQPTPHLIDLQDVINAYETADWMNIGYTESVAIA